MKYLIGFAFTFFAFLYVNAQELSNQINILKVYPFSIAKDEFRIGIEKEIKNGESIEIGAGYLYRMFERTECHECYLIPSYSSFNGNGVSIRINRTSFRDSASHLSGFYTSFGLIYKFIFLERPEPVPSASNLPYGYYYSSQNSIFIQGLVGKQFCENRFIYNIYGGLSIYSELNYYKFLGFPYSSFQNTLKKNPAVDFGASVNLGMSFGYKYVKKRMM